VQGVKRHRADLQRAHAQVTRLAPTDTATDTRSLTPNRQLTSAIIWFLTDGSTSCKLSERSLAAEPGGAAAAWLLWPDGQAAPARPADSLSDAAPTLRACSCRLIELRPAETDRHAMCSQL
jgi:hypothetical protein